jgi:hypothetical protein
MNNLQIVQRALEILLDFLKPFVENKLMTLYGERYWVYLENGDCFLSKVTTEKPNENSNFIKYKDVLYYINGIIKNWSVFQTQFILPNYSLCLCHSMKHFRNKWAHQDNFSFRETHRLLDEVQTFLEHLNMSCSEIDNMRKYMLELYFTEEVSKYQANKGDNINNIYNLTQEEDSLMLDNTAINFQKESASIMNKSGNDSNSLHEANFQKLLQSNQNNPNDKYIISYFDEN